MTEAGKLGRMPLRDRRRPFVAALLCCMAATAPGPVPAQDEVPFITTPDHVTLAMLDLAAVRAGDHVIDLGSGDGRIVITAARRYGASGLGVELVADLVALSRVSARAAGVAERVEFREQDLFATDLGRATVVTMYLLPEVNLQLRPRLLALKPGTRVVSHDWDMGDWAPDRTLTIDVPDKVVGREKLSRVHLWKVPAQVQGLWCAAGDGSGSGNTNGNRRAVGRASLDIAQRFQQFSAVLSAMLPAQAGAAAATVFDGRIEGTLLRRQGAGAATLALHGPQLRVVDADGRTPGLEKGAVFERAHHANCG